MNHIQRQCPIPKAIGISSENLNRNHKRWDIEIVYDEIKTHQCATLRGQMPTIIRSKRSDLDVKVQV